LNSYWKHVLCFSCATLLFNFNLFSQTDVGLEVQIYPTGFIPGLSIDHHVGTKHALYLRAGFNFFNHRDLGEWLSEEGWGYGASLGYKRYLKEDQLGIRVGIKNDIWFNKVDWAGFNQFNSPIFGRTEIIVLQPTAVVEYVWDFGNLFLVPSVAFGMEWNVKTVGAPTGQGPIALIGFQIGRR